MGIGTQSSDHKQINATKLARLYVRSTLLWVGGGGERVVWTSPTSHCIHVDPEIQIFLSDSDLDTTDK